MDDLTYKVLSEGHTDGLHFHITGETLPRPDYLRIAKVIKDLGGKWKNKKQGFVFPYEPAPLNPGRA